MSDYNAISSLLSWDGSGRKDLSESLNSTFGEKVSFLFCCNFQLHLTASYFMKKKCPDNIWFSNGQNPK